MGHIHRYPFIRITSEIVSSMATIEQCSSTKNCETEIIFVKKGIQSYRTLVLQLQQFS